jgi:hypothetical protein
MSLPVSWPRSTGNHLYVDYEWTTSFCYVTFYQGLYYEFQPVTLSNMSSLNLPRNIELWDFRSADTFLRWYNHIAKRAFMSKHYLQAATVPPTGVHLIFTSP